jgi:ribonuclease P protein component
VRKGDFRKVFEQGAKYPSKYLVIYAMASGLAVSRLGFAVSRKIGSAVVRNRIRRRLREAMRMELKAHPLRYDFIIVARNASAEADFPDLRKCVHRVLTGLVNENDLDRAN